jgi:hypothetical protein
MEGRAVAELHIQVAREVARAAIARVGTIKCERDSVLGFTLDTNLELAAMVLNLSDRAEEATRLRGRLDVALALLNECIGPLEVSAAIIEDEDGGEAIDALITKVRKFVADAQPAVVPASSNDQQEQS